MAKFLMFLRLSGPVEVRERQATRSSEEEPSDSKEEAEKEDHKKSSKDGKAAYLVQNLMLDCVIEICMQRAQKKGNQRARRPMPKRRKPGQQRVAEWKFANKAECKSAGQKSLLELKFAALAESTFATPAVGTQPRPL